MPAALVPAKPIQPEPAQEAQPPQAAANIGPPGRFDPQGKAPSEFTIELRKGLKATLPFEDRRDFEEAKKGFIAEPPYTKIMADAGQVAWDVGSYSWLLKDQDFDSINPSLLRQAVLNMAYGLCEVVPGRIYQERGYDLANISFIKGDTGWIVFDPLTAKETARAALELINEKLGKRPVVGVVYSHSHVDHFGGARGDQPLSRALRRQPDQPDPAVGRRLGPALRGDDGGRREDPRARPAALRRGAYLYATEILNKLVFAEPKNQAARPSPTAAATT